MLDSPDGWWSISEPVTFPQNILSPIKRPSHRFLEPTHRAPSVREKDGQGLGKGAAEAVGMRYVQPSGGRGDAAWKIKVVFV